MEYEILDLTDAPYTSKFANAAGLLTSYGGTTYTGELTASHNAANINSIENLYFKIRVTLDDDFKALVADDPTYSLDYNFNLVPSSKIFPVDPTIHAYVLSFHCFPD